MEFQRKEQWMAIENMFRTLCEYYKNDNCGPESQMPILEIRERAKVMLDWMEKTWPMQEIKDEPFPSHNPQRQPVGQKGKFCPVCNAPMIYQENLSHPKAPNWKCSDRKCKFSFNKETGKWETGGLYHRRLELEV